MKQYSSIFNDVLGPVMNGPSSSHTAASVRIGLMVRQMVPGKPVHFKAYFDKDGALAPCFHEQWADYGLTAGLLGMYPDDERLSSVFRIAEENGLKAEFNITSFPNSHPNTYKMQLSDEYGNSIDSTALSVGGGMVEIIEVNGFKTEICGGFYEFLIFSEASSEEYCIKKSEQISSMIISDNLVSYDYKSDGRCMYTIKSEDELPAYCIERIKDLIKADRLIKIKPVLPVVSQINPRVPFIFAKELVEISEQKDLPVWKTAVMYESERGGISEDEVYDKMKNLVKIMKTSRANGLSGTKYENRILGAQSVLLSDPNVKKRLIKDDVVNSIIQSVSAIMEVKSSMGVFVAAPTAGSCGCLTGTVLAAAEYFGMDDDQIVKAMFAAGIVGVFISERATFAAEVAGCQAECGSGSGMTAAALVQLMDGTAKEVCSAASMALQNVFGMTCDPVAMAVEVPCLGKNILAGVNAFTSANMALAGFNAVIPLDETIDAFNEAGRMIHPALRCTGAAGITATPSAKKIEEKMKNGEKNNISL
ncbi:MAG: L-serine ammonia-lyase, iron-sulfur-dependent, subunit alpha [Bacillota bacterium]|nr:L-serine ammonia-lyase, iron-sulfur-dependent, subunit alpha [Bacillota bacterium]